MQSTPATIHNPAGDSRHGVLNMRKTIPSRRRRLALSVSALTALVLAMLAAAPTAMGATLLAPHTEPGVLAGELAPPGQFGFECFTLTEGKSPNTAVVLETSNFGRDRVIVGRSKLSCEAAFRYPAGANPVTAPDPAQIMQCFNVDRGLDPNRQVTLTSETVNITATVGKAQMMCENASKRLPPQSAPVGLKVDTAWQCFALSDVSATPGQPATIVTQNFGPGTDEVRRGRFLCEEALKRRSGFEPYGAASGVAYLCSAFGGAASNAPAILETRNFGEDGVVFGAPSLWCENVHKALGPATITIPAGRRLTLTHAELDACNPLAYGYQVNNGPLLEAGSKGFGCFEQPIPDVVVGPFGSDVTIRIWLRDDFCAATFFSDGNHAHVVAIVPGLEVTMGDGGGGCEFVNLPSPSFGNMHVDLIRK